MIMMDCNTLTKINIHKFTLKYIYISQCIYIYIRVSNFAAIIIAKSSKFTPPVVMRLSDFWYL